MPGSVLIAVSNGFGGYGDFLFALKLAEQVRKNYIALLGKDKAPEIKLITQASGQQIIKNLKGDTEFNVEVLTPDELKEKIEKKELEIASIIEGPVFESSLIQRINKALEKQSHPVPLIMMPEYAYSGTSHRHMIENQRQFRKKALNKIFYVETIYTGFNSKAGERGIILSDNLIHPEEPSVLSSRLEEKISEALLGGKDVEAYQTNTDMYFQYSHDTFSTTPESSAAERFLKTHRIYAKSSKKNQDILMVGKTERKKREALEKIKKQLIADGFTKISFYNAETKKEEYLFGRPNIEGRHYRVVYSSGMSHASIIAAQALSGDLVGATGDQSFGEAVSGDKILIYECLSHKRLLRDEYYNQLKKLDPSCADILNLFRNAKSESDYKLMEALLTEEMKVKLKNLSKCFRESGELTKFTVNAAMPIELLSQQIIRGHILPYSNDPNSTSSLERTLRFGNFDAIGHVVERHTSTIDERRKFCEILTKKTHEGYSLLSVLRNAKPGLFETSRASYLAIQFNIDKYKAPSGSKREKMFNAYKELISTFTILGEGQHDEDALIGLMLLTTKNISNEYFLFSPRKGLLFGSQFYSNLDDTLKDLDINLKKITPQERQRYYSALARVMENNPNLIANEYILDSLSREANIVLPKIPPLLTASKAREFLQSENFHKADSTIFHTATGIYKTHSVPLDQGGWGSVYAARHYSSSESGIKISTPLAIKMMSSRNQLAMNKEAELFKQAYPEGHFEQFNKNDTTYLAMPLFSGVPLDKYLMENLELSKTSRHEIATSLLECLNSIHKHGVIHNDIKPKNLLYDPVAKKIHIVDFGCAEKESTRVQFRDVNTAKFAIEYMPPEYLEGGLVTNKTDVYSLTLSLAEILGINKHNLVKGRMERALMKIKEPIKTSIIKAFNSTGSLDDAMFARDVSRHWKNPEFKNFITKFVNEQYDFRPYEEILGADVIELLNSMQNATPAQRPSIENVLEILNRKEAEKILESNL
ncbi:serine/threonine-protein kinase [Legionella worsleiensis]|uniref:Serine/threonine protein kinase n=1 Tax=Legionella worsleiensis TaxID=45076 RepID=A0A0W1A431_9GAMM|nr:protein kinase [Legionella worsleiensis]KTD76119.1 serine/threonine protein kinase [Legionella worsleiensis]STY33303.1 serine/threonine protein kinase [Legionella worsleiensis]